MEKQENSLHSKTSETQSNTSNLQLHFISFFSFHAFPRISTSELIYSIEAVRGSIQNSQQSSLTQILALRAIGLLDHIRTKIVAKP